MPNIFWRGFIFLASSQSKNVQDLILKTGLHKVFPKLEQMSNPACFFFRFTTEKTRMAKAIRRHLFKQSRTRSRGRLIFLEGRAKF